VDEISFAEEKAARLVRKLLAFSSKQEAEIRPLSLNHVIGDLGKMLKRIIGEDIDLQCNLAIPLPLVDADASLVEQVIMNLVVNARDAMRRGGALKIETQTVHVDAAHVQAHLQARAGEFVCLRVSDTGAGIAPEHLPHIFEPFFTTKAPGKGTGLGLATVYGIVNQHQGWIEVASQRGAGTIFSIYFPPSTATETEVSRLVEPAAPVGGTETILLVEDEWSVRRVTGRILEFCGYKLVEASTGREALKLWDKYNGRFDLLLTDHIMPGGLNGRELAEKLRLKKPGLKAVFMSGYSTENFKKMADTGEPGLNYLL
jgi:CheY-like chemotaxis protein